MLMTYLLTCQRESNMIRTKDLIEYVKNTNIGNAGVTDTEMEYRAEIVARLKEHSQMRTIITNPHLTGDHTMKDLLKLVRR